MTSATTHWGRAIAGALLAETLQVAAAVGWVAIYSYLIAPGQPVAAYERHAQASGPWVSIVAGFPIFYAVARRVARTRPTALAMFACFLVLDMGLVLLAPNPVPSGVLPLFGASYVSKLFACHLGGRHAAAQPAAFES